MRAFGGIRAMVVIGVVLGVGAGLPAAGAGASVSASPGWRVAHYFGSCQSDGARSVAATGSADAWATGQAFGFQCDSPGLLVARWDGRSWRELTPPHEFEGVSQDADGTAVAALSSSYAWAFVDRAVNPRSQPFESFALLWRGGRWQSFRLPDGLRVIAAAVFSSSNAWAVGLIGDSRYTARFNGKRWQRVSIPVRPKAAAFAGPRNIWLVGQLNVRGQPLALAHWTGRWHIFPLPPGIAPSGDFISDPWVVSDGSQSAWVALTIQRGGFDNDVGGALVHWTGSSWIDIQVPFPTKGLGPLSRDGGGGLWIASSATTTSYPCPSCDVDAMFHYKAGTWSRAPVNAPGLTVTAMRLIPRTRSVWASGTGVQVPGGQGDAVGVMLKYGP